MADPFEILQGGWVKVAIEAFCFRIEMDQKSETFSNFYFSVALVAIILRIFTNLEWNSGRKE